MLSYQNFKQLWKDDNLELNACLSSTYWTSVFNQKELCFIVQTILKARTTNTFAEFLDAICMTPITFSNVFDYEIDQTQVWMKRKTIYPKSVKCRYVFELISNEIENMRRRKCVRCGEYFLSREASDFCEPCKSEEMAEMEKVEKKGVIIQIEVTV